MPLPTGVTTGVVTGTFTKLGTQGNATPVDGMVVTFTPSSPVVLDAGATQTLAITPVQAIIKGGTLQDLLGNTGVTLVATDSPGINPTGFTWQVAFTGPVPTGLTTFAFALPGGTTKDLATLSPVPPAPAVPSMVVTDGTVGGYVTAGGPTQAALDGRYATGGELRSKSKPGATDQTSIIQGELQSLYNAGGGTLVLPSSAFGPVTTKVTNLTMPNDGAALATQPPIIIRGQGGHHSGAGTPVKGGTILEFTGTDTYGLIKTNGLGRLSMRDLTLQNKNVATTTPFIYTTNTTLLICGVAFIGANTGVACNQDAIVLGGPNQVEGGSGWTDGFQGYGTVISENYFSGIRRAVYGRAFCNATVIRDNTVWITCGTNLVGGAAFEIDGTDGLGTGVQFATGNEFSGNLVEMGGGYYYSFKVIKGTVNTFFGNTAFDPHANSVAQVRFEGGSVSNLVIPGFITTPMVAISDTSAAKTGGSLLSAQEASYFSGTLKAVKVMADSNTGVIDGAFVWKRNGVEEYQMYQSASANTLYLRDLVNARMLVTYSPGATDTASGVTYGACLTALGGQSFFGPTTNRLQLGSLGTTDVWLDALGASSNANVNINMRAKGTGVVQAMSTIRATGSAYLAVLRGNTASRPTGIAAGDSVNYFDTTLNKPIWWNGTVWVDATGTTV